MLALFVIQIASLVIRGLDSRDCLELSGLVMFHRMIRSQFCPSFSHSDRTLSEELHSVFATTRESDTFHWPVISVSQL